MSDIKLVVRTSQWQVSTHHRQHQLRNTSTAKLGWQRLVVIAANDAAESFLQHGGSIMARQNYQLQGVPLHHDDPRKASLVFYRHNPLNTVTLDWIDNRQSIDDNKETPVFTLQIKPISGPKAWFFMLRAVSQKDKTQGQKASQIYRITRARQKRAGREHALRKLVQAYQPLLQHQLTSCEPFNYWRLHNEPDGQQQLLHYAANSSPITCTALTDRAAVNKDHWYYIDSERFTKARQFDRLIRAAVEVAERQQASIVYWDHDRFDDNEQRVLPSFKPDWNPELLLAQDYIGPCFAVKGERLLALKQSVGSLNKDHYQLLINLLATASIPPKVAHVPVILQHCQRPELNSSELELNRQAALQNWLTITDGSPANSFSSAVEEGVRKVNFALPPTADKGPTVSIIIPTRDALDITRNCVNSVLERTDYTDFEIIIVDNQSSDPATLQWFEHIQQVQQQVRVLSYDAPFNYSAINNFAVGKARAEYVCLLNNDTEVINSAWLGELLQVAQRPAIGAVGAKLYYPDNTVQHAGVVLGLWGLAGHAHKNFTRHAAGYGQRLASLQNFSAVTAACLVVAKSIFQEVGGFNENDLTVAFNDVDLCLKIQQAGYRNAWTPYAELYHYESKSRGKEDSPSKKAREKQEVAYMQQHWQAVIDNDPAYNPNLTRLQEDFGISLDPCRLTRHFHAQS